MFVLFFVGLAIAATVGYVIGREDGYYKGLEERDALWDEYHGVPRSE